MYSAFDIDDLTSPLTVVTQTNNTVPNPFAVFERHGQIRCGTLAVRDLDQSLALYRDFLALTVDEQGQISETLAVSWGLSSMAGSRYAVLQPESGALSYLRLVEVKNGPKITPAKTLGWNAFEISVKDVFALSEKLKKSEFDIVGPPRLVDGFTNFIPMQVFGPDGEVLFLNQVIHSDEHTELPKAESAVDQLFIAVVASAEREKTAKEHVRFLGLDQGPAHSLRYSLINRAFDFDPETETAITMVNSGRLPFSQIDQYPPQASIRPAAPGALPLGNSLLSVMVDCLDDLPISEVAQGKVTRVEESFYQGRRVQTIKGSASELIELIEIES